MKKKWLICLLLCMVTMLMGCEQWNSGDVTGASKVDFEELEVTENVELTYATQFSMEKYGEYTMIHIVEDCDYIVVPEGKKVPKHLPENTVVLQQPLDHTYLVSTSVMDLICHIDALENVSLSGTKEEDWYVEGARQSMMDGKISYAGKYSAPDYEVIVENGCDFVIENTMIYHNPEVKEKLEKLGMPVLVEKSSYESHPLGRLEWIKLYGVLYGKEELANTFYENQLASIEPIIEKDSTGVTVAYFYITANGLVNVRKPQDYISKMIGLAGGEYVLKDAKVEEENALSTMNMQMEDFYTQAKDADILIYNSTIAGEIYSVEDLISKNKLFKDFKAVKEGTVYCTTNDFFQESTGVASFVEDLNKIYNDSDCQNLYYLKHLE